MFRSFSRAMLVFSVLVTSVGGGLCSGEGAAENGVDSFAAFETLIHHRLEIAETDAQRDAAEGLLHQMRNHEVMSEVVSAIGEMKRPQKIRYLASGCHMAPLALCELLPAKAQCALVFSEIDGSAQSGIDAFLKAAGASGLVEYVETTERLNGKEGSRIWNFEMSGHKVRLELLVEAAGPLIRSGSLKDADIVISHDWSGDPLANLTLIRDYLLEARSSELQVIPLLMMEDLEAHPYAIDLTFFGPRARAAGAYGHRSSDAGIGRHGDVELGVPIFGGAVLLAFDDRWFLHVDTAELDAVIDFLFFYRFDSARQNVLEGGQDPLLAPRLLDWWTGFGTRSIRGFDIRIQSSFRRDMVAAVMRKIDVFPPLLQTRLACALELYRSILSAKAQGAEVREVMPDSVYQRRPIADAFPSQQMEELYHEALKNMSLYRSDQEDEEIAASRALEQYSTEDARHVLELCSCRKNNATENESWVDRYRSFEACLE